MLMVVSTVLSDAGRTFLPTKILNLNQDMLIIDWFDQSNNKRPVKDSQVAQFKHRPIAGRL